jgi:hypothetical protein
MSRDADANGILRDADGNGILRDADGNGILRDADGNGILRDADVNAVSALILNAISNALMVLSPLFPAIVGRA